MDILPKTKKRTVWRPWQPGQVDLATGFLTPRRAKQNFQLAMNKIKVMRKKINTMRVQKRRLKLRLASYEAFISHLKNKNFLSEEAEAAIEVKIKMWLNLGT